MRQIGVDGARELWRFHRFILLATVGFIALGSTGWGEEARRPNIVVIMSDDVGWSDLGCYGGEIETPRLDALARDGLRFTQFYNTGRCCPTRASLLTGLYPHQAGVGHMLRNTGHAGYTEGLNDHCLTIAEVLRTAGYRSYAVGKWHVTRHTAADAPKEDWPLQRGFDGYYGTITGGGNYFDPTSLTRGNERISPFNDPEYRSDSYYYTNALSDNAVRFIQDHQAAHGEEPFFLYVAYTAAHWPMHALPEDIERFRGKYGKGYDAIRQARWARQRKMGLVDSQWELSPPPFAEPEEGLSEWEQRCMEVYAAMLYRMDAGIGKIVDSLKASGQLENTLILYLQDNGGCAEEVGRKAESDFPNIERPAAPTLPPLDPTGVIDLGVHYRQTRDGYPTRRGNRVMPGPADTFVAYGEAWANVSNTPFRLYKHYVHEGGISTPLVAHWPAGIQRAGELEAQPGHLIDVMATCVELAGANYPKEKDGKTIVPLEGKSLTPAFRGEEIAREALYWEHESNRAIRIGDWKLAAVGPKGPWELYDLRVDRTEMHDLSKEQPEKVTEMAAQWEAWAKRAQVLPIDGWKDQPAGERGSFSKKKRFQLEGNASLGRGKSPDVAGRGFVVDVRLEKLGTSGVLVAQGGVARGWALYQRLQTEKEQEGQTATAFEFAVRSPKGLEVARLEGVPPETKRVGVRLGKDGEVVFRLDGVEKGRGKVARLVDAMPVDGLQVGRDENGLVGDYSQRNAYDGTIQGVVIELE